MKKTRRALLISVGILIILCLIVPFLIPITPLTDTVPPDELADPDSHFIEIDGLQIHYKIYGEGEPTIVLLHGFVSSVFAWREVLEPLSAYGTVIAFDRPGFGLTERHLLEDLDAESPYSAGYHAELTLKLVEALGFESAVLIGNSAGGSVAIDAAQRYPDRVDALVLVDAAVYYEPGPPAWAAWLLRIPQIRRIGPLLVRALAGYGRNILDIAWHDPSLITPEMWQGYIKPTNADNWDLAFWQLVLTSDPPDLEEVVLSLDLPVLVVSGDDDLVVPLEQSLRLASEIPGAELAIIEHCGHLPQEECPQAFLQAVMSFLASLP
jgi:pimeloyl-ACP methyl ester carboxylesterase